jgi:uncharacterized protein YuzE
MSAILDRVQIEAAPVVEIDTEAPAAYIRVSQNPVSRTVALRDDKILSTVDLDASGKIVGIEVVWPSEFGIEKLIAESGANVEFLPSAIQRTRYVSAKHLDI